MEVSLKKTLYMENKDPPMGKKNTSSVVTSDSLNQELMYIFFVSIVSFLVGSTLNHFTPDVDDDKEGWIIAVEILCGFVMMFIVFIWMYLLTSKYFLAEELLLFPTHYVLLSGLLVSFFGIFLITQSKTIQKIRLFGDRLWESSSTEDKDEDDEENHPPKKTLSSKDQQRLKEIVKTTTATSPHRETSLDDVMGMQHLQPNPSAHLQSQMPNELLPQVDYFNNFQHQLNNQQLSAQATSYENFSTDTDKQLRNDYIYGYRQNSYEPMMSGFSGSMY